MKSCALLAMLTFALPVFANATHCADQLVGKVKTVCAQVLYDQSPGDMLNKGLLRNRQVMEQSCRQGFIPNRREIAIETSTGFERLNITETFSCEPW